MKLDSYVALPDLSKVKLGDVLHVQPETAPEPVPVRVVEITLTDIHLDRLHHEPDEASGYIIPREWPGGVDPATRALAACRAYGERTATQPYLEEGRQEIVRELFAASLALHEAEKEVGRLGPESS